MARYNKKHGLRQHKLYRVWNSIKMRCYNPKNNKYHYYGGRGILMCDEWKNDFQKFYDWSICHGYNENLEIDRINNDLGYFPENCRYVTILQQVNNRRNTRNLTYNGKTQNILNWSKELKMNHRTLYNRFKKGWSVEKILTTPIKIYK